eukprot:7848879-Pyramimonas_sp.AAC.2
MSSKFGRGALTDWLAGLPQARSQAEWPPWVGRLGEAISRHGFLGSIGRARALGYILSRGTRGEERRKRGGEGPKRRGG